MRTHMHWRKITQIYEQTYSILKKLYNLRNKFE
jgi:hypothetical protein